MSSIDNGELYMVADAGPIGLGVSPAYPKAKAALREDTPLLCKLPLLLFALWACEELNLGPHAYQACALTT